MKRLANPLLREDALWNLPGGTETVLHRGEWVQFNLGAGGVPEDRHRQSVGLGQRPELGAVLQKLSTSSSVRLIHL